MSEGRHRRSYVTQESDIIKAVTKDMDLNSLKYEYFDVITVTQIKGGINFCEMAVVETSHGDYFVERIRSDAGDIYTKVYRYI